MKVFKYLLIGLIFLNGFTLLSQKIPLDSTVRKGVLNNGLT